MERYCMALDYSDEMSFLWSPNQDGPALCGAPARFMVRVNDPEIGGRLWLCADCYDVYRAWIGHEPCEC
jgi:hypothetical protein